MLVSQILKSKASAGVVTIKPDAPVSDAAKVLAEKKIGTVVVSADGEHADGILSERDIVRELGRRGPSCMADSVDEIMTANIVSCSRTESSDEVLGKMTAGRFRHMPVMEGGEMVGLISIGDVVKAQISQLSMEKEALEGMIKGF